MQPIGLPRLWNLVNGYRNSSIKPKRFCSHVTSRWIFSLCGSVKWPIFFLKKNSFKNARLCEHSKIIWLGSELFVRVLNEFYHNHRTHFKSLESDCKMCRLVHCWHFLSCKCIINELTRTSHNCQSSHTYLCKP